MNQNFKEMWLLIQGLQTSMQLMFWTAFLIVAVLYIFAIVATEMIGPRRNSLFQGDEVAEEFFGTLSDSMLSMFQIMTLDTWADMIARPLMPKLPFVSLFCVFFIFIAVFILMNLVTAVIVENAFKIVTDDLELQAKLAYTKKKEDFRGLAELFLQIDEDGSGELTTQEFSRALINPKVQQQLTVLEIQREELEDIWNVLDDGDGVLTIEEFTSGLRRMKGPTKSKDVMEAMKVIKTLHEKHSGLLTKSVLLETKLQACEKDANELAKDMQQINAVLSEADVRLEEHLRASGATLKLA